VQEERKKSVHKLFSEEQGLILVFHFFAAPVLFAIKHIPKNDSNKFCPKFMTLYMAGSIQSD
jgi:hypothetical protein